MNDNPIEKAKCHFDEIERLLLMIHDQSCKELGNVKHDSWAYVGDLSHRVEQLKILAGEVN